VFLDHLQAGAHMLRPVVDDVRGGAVHLAAAT
jgi:hypothetical protein